MWPLRAVHIFSIITINYHTQTQNIKFKYNGGLECTYVQPK